METIYMEEYLKQLLLKDLCGRLPYRVNGLITVHKTMNEISTFNGVIDGKIYDRFANLQDSWYDNIPSIKPYLRPMASMTIEEICKIEDIVGEEFTYKDGALTLSTEDVIRIPICKMSELLQFMYQRHLDVNNLISMGLALEAPEGMYD